MLKSKDKEGKAGKHFQASSFGAPAFIKKAGLQAMGLTFSTFCRKQTLLVIGS